MQSLRGLLSVGDLSEGTVDVEGKDVQFLELRDVWLSDAQVLLILQGMSAVSALGTLMYNGKTYLPIMAEGFHAARPPAGFDRVVGAIPHDEAIPLPSLVQALMRCA